MQRWMYRYEPVVGIKTARVEVFMHEQQAPDGDLPAGWKATRAEATEAAIEQMIALADSLRREVHSMRVGTTRGEGT